MPAINIISADKLLRLIGTPACPALIDVRPSGDLVPGSIRRPAEEVEAWAGSLGAASGIVSEHPTASIRAGQAGVPIRRSNLSAEMMLIAGMRRPFLPGRDASACRLMG